MHAGMARFRIELPEGWQCVAREPVVTWQNVARRGALQASALDVPPHVRAVDGSVAFELLMTLASGTGWTMPRDVGTFEGAEQRLFWGKFSGPFPDLRMWVACEGVRAIVVTWVGEDGSGGDEAERAVKHYLGAGAYRVDLT